MKTSFFSTQDVPHTCEAGGASGIQKDRAVASVASAASAAPGPSASADAPHGAGAKDAANATDAAHHHSAETAEKLERHEGVENVEGLKPKQLQLNSSAKEALETEVNESQHSLRKACKAVDIHQ